MQKHINKNRLQFADYFSGTGLEIGALNEPFPVNAGVKVIYSDILNTEQIDALCPEGIHPDMISDSESFPSVNDNSFDFIIANHVLEHLTNPIRALIEWFRILKDEGYLFITIPDKRFTFDRYRQRTKLSHLIDDYKSTQNRSDLNFPHLKEWAIHVEKKKVGSEEYLAWISKQKYKGYSVHNHVWVIADIISLMIHLWRKENIKFSLIKCKDTITHSNEFTLILKTQKRQLSLIQKIKTFIQYLFWLGTYRLKYFSYQLKFAFLIFPVRLIIHNIPSPIKSWIKFFLIRK